MKVGDLVRYKYNTLSAFESDRGFSKPFGLILYVNEEGGTLKVVNWDGQIDWFVTSYCEVISEGR